MPVDVTKVIAGVATLYTAPVGTAMPADTVAEGVAWASTWVHHGATEEGISFINGTDTNDIFVEEQSPPARILVSRRNVRVTFALAEDVVASMKLSYGGGVSTPVVAGTGQPGKTTLTLSDTLDEVAVGFEAINAFGFWRRVHIPRAVSVADVTTTYRRATNNRSYAVELRAICASSDIKIVDKTAAATA